LAWNFQPVHGSGRAFFISRILAWFLSGTVNAPVALVKKASGTNASFKDAAVEASYKFRYKPAIQNDRPVAVWVGYRFVFELK